MPRTPLKQALTGANIRHSSAHVQHYTPPEIIEAAREVLRGIDLDPASSERANRVVKATLIFDEQENGFLREWRDNFNDPARVFLNPPGGMCDEKGRHVPKDARKGTKVQSSAKAWWFKLAEEWVRGNVESAIYVGFSVEILQSTQVETPYYGTPREPGRPRFTEHLPIPLHFPMCFPRTRVAYYVEKGHELVKGTQPTHASVLIYLPPRRPDRFGFGLANFERVFGALGCVVRPQRLAFESEVP